MMIEEFKQCCRNNIALKEAIGYYELAEILGSDNCKYWGKFIKKANKSIMKITNDPVILCQLQDFARGEMWK